MLFKQFIGLTISALLTIGNNGFVSPAITWLNNSSLNITIGSSVNYYFDLEFNEWYPVSGSVDTGGTGRCDTNIIIGNGTDPMTGFIQYNRSSITRGTNLISYDENVAVTNDMIYFYNVSSFTLTTFTSTDTGDLNQPTFTVTFTNGYIWDERDASDLYSLVNLMQANISNISTNTLNTYNQLSAINSNIANLAVDVDAINTKTGNMLALIAGEVVALENLYNLENTLKNYEIPYYSWSFYKALTRNSNYSFSENNQLNPVDKYFNYPVLTRSSTQSKPNSYEINAYGDMIAVYYTWSSNSLIPYTFNTDTLIQNERKSVGAPFAKTYTRFNFNGQIYFRNQYSFPMIPIYIGLVSSLPDDIAVEFGIDKYADTTNELEEAGDDLKNAYNQEDVLIQTVTSDLDNNVPTVSTQNSVLGSLSFFNAANWVKTQFDRITITEAPILGNLLSFSLIIGLAIAFIGRRLGD